MIANDLDHYTPIDNVVFILYSEPYSNLELIQQFYKVSKVVIKNDDGETSSSYYELLEPIKHTGWGEELVPLSSNLVVTHRFDGSDEYMQITPEKKIVEVDHDDKYVVIKSTYVVIRGNWSHNRVQI